MVFRSLRGRFMENNYLISKYFTPLLKINNLEKEELRRYHYAVKKHLKLYGDTVPPDILDALTPASLVFHLPKSNVDDMFDKYGDKTLFILIIATNVMRFINLFDKVIDLGGEELLTDKISCYVANGAYYAGYLDRMFVKKCIKYKNLVKKLWNINLSSEVISIFISEFSDDWLADIEKNIDNPKIIKLLFQISKLIGENRQKVNYIVKVFSSELPSNLINYDIDWKVLDSIDFEGIEVSSCISFKNFIQNLCYLNRYLVQINLCDFGDIVNLPPKEFCNMILIKYVLNELKNKGIEKLVSFAKIMGAAETEEDIDFINTHFQYIDFTELENYSIADIKLCFEIFSQVNKNLIDLIKKYDIDRIKRICKEISDIELLRIILDDPTDFTFNFIKSLTDIEIDLFHTAINVYKNKKLHYADFFKKEGIEYNVINIFLALYCERIYGTVNSNSIIRIWQGEKEIE